MTSALSSVCRSCWRVSDSCLIRTIRFGSTRAVPVQQFGMSTPVGDARRPSFASQLGRCLRPCFLHVPIHVPATKRACHASKLSARCIVASALGPTRPADTPSDAIISAPQCPQAILRPRYSSRTRSCLPHVVHPCEKNCCRIRAHSFVMRHLRLRSTIGCISSHCTPHDRIYGLLAIEGQNLSSLRMDGYQRLAYFLSTARRKTVTCCRKSRHSPRSSTTLLFGTVRSRDICETKRESAGGLGGTAAPGDLRLTLSRLLIDLS